MFSQKLDHSSALYFTITVFSTVGFGDIVPATDSARLIVSAQMIIDLVIIGVVVRLLVNAAKMGLERAHQPPGDEEALLPPGWSSRRAEQSHPGRVTTKFSEPVRLATGTYTFADWTRPIVIPRTYEITFAGRPHRPLSRPSTTST